MADRKKKFAAEKKRVEDEMEEIKQSNEVGTCFTNKYSVHENISGTIKFWDFAENLL